MRQHGLLYIKQGLKAHLRTFSPIIIIEGQYLQTFLHTLHDYHEKGGESIAMVQKRNIEALNKILSDNPDKEIVVGTHGTALSTILNFYDNRFDCDDFLRISDWMPYIIELDFECPRYSFELVGKQEHCHVEKEFKGKR